MICGASAPHISYFLSFHIYIIIMNKWMSIIKIPSKIHKRHPEVCGIFRRNRQSKTHTEKENHYDEF